MSEDHDSTPISELDESTSLNANDEFIISTKDPNEVYSSKKVKLSTVQNASPAAGITVKEEGTALATNATSLNFVGSTVTATGTGAEKTITITEPAGGGGGENTFWSSGWQAVGPIAGQTRILTHNLGTTDVVFDVFAADDASGTNAVRIESMASGGAGAHIRIITNNGFYLQLGTTYNIWTGQPLSSTWANKFFKVVATASGGGGGGGGAKRFIDVKRFKFGTIASGTNTTGQHFNVCGSAQPLGDKEVFTAMDGQVDAGTWLIYIGFPDTANVGSNTPGLQTWYMSSLSDEERDAWVVIGSGLGLEERGNMPMKLEVVSNQCFLSPYSMNMGVGCSGRIHVTANGDLEAFLAAGNKNAWSGMVATLVRIL